MKISYNWLKQYIVTDLSPEAIGQKLTDCGLEVEGIEKFETIKGGLKGVVIGEVKTKIKHPDADRLNLTTVDVGTGTDLNIVCGASNVEAGQKVVVATVGAVLHPTSGDPLEIKKSKIRGQASEGMICAEDEIGLGTSHEGIMVLESSAKVGSPASEYFKIEEDHIFEIGLTPNRADATSHFGVARDLAAAINAGSKSAATVHKPVLHEPVIGHVEKPIQVIVENEEACPRYSGIVISGVDVKESPEWLKNRLRSIGVKSINNIVDVTNFVLHEIGQPLHAFDADKIKGNKVVVRNVIAGTTFTTLDGVERKLKSSDLMICNDAEPMCIAGVFGGVESGVSLNTKSIFLESAYFNSISIRKTAKAHGLKTDASFRYERGTDPNITLYALKRAATLIKEVAGGHFSSAVIDHYPKPVENFKIKFSLERAEKIIGKNIGRDIIKNIIRDLDIEIVYDDNERLELSIPPYKVDVTREIDVVEEILRIYGYNNIELPQQLKSSLSFAQKPDKEKIQNIISDLLSANGFAEILTNSLTKEEYTQKFLPERQGKSVKILNPLSQELNVLRQDMLFTGLEIFSYNQNRKSSDLKLYEFGKTYTIGDEPTAALNYNERASLSLYITGKKSAESWNAKNTASDFYLFKAYIENIFSRLGISGLKTNETESGLFSYGFSYSIGKRKIAEAGSVKQNILKSFDISSEVFYCTIDWKELIKLASSTDVKFKEIPKYPSVRRDLALLINKEVKYQQLEQLAIQTERNFLKEVNLFDVYEGDKLPQGKKSYAMSFILQDEKSTLTDKQIEKVMEKLMKTFETQVGAEIRK